MFEMAIWKILYWLFMTFFICLITFLVSVIVGAVIIAVMQVLDKRRKDNKTE